MTVVSCSVDERYVNPLFEVFDGGDFVLTSYRDVEETSATMQIFLPDPADAPRAAEALAAAGRIVGLELAPETGTIPDEDWKLSYRKHFKTEVISPRLVVRPPWEAVTPAPGQKVLTLDPGIAFGTGQHPTTRACLDAIDALAVEGTDRSFLDVGCGSGILSIAARTRRRTASARSFRTATSPFPARPHRRTWWRRTCSPRCSCASRARSARS